MSINNEQIFQLLDTEVVMLAKSYLKCLGKDVLVCQEVGDYNSS